MVVRGVKGRLDVDPVFLVQLELVRGHQALSLLHGYMEKKVSRTVHDQQDFYALYETLINEEKNTEF